MPEQEQQKNESAQSSSTVQTETDRDLLQALNEVKQNSVPKEQYDKIAQQNRDLIDRVMNNKPIEDEPAAKLEKVDIQALRNDLADMDKDKLNLEFVTTLLQLHDAVIDGGGQDPFLPQGQNITITSDDRESAQRLYEGLKHCVDYAQGDSEVFTNELMRITKDVRRF